MLGSIGKAQMAAPPAPEKRDLVLTLRRLEPFGDALHGDLYLNGHHECVTLENAAKAIVAGRYQVVLTESPRVREGSLWSPRADHKLPLLLDVKDRDGIRLHAANYPAQLEGCIAPGTKRDGEVIESSRVALIAVMAKIEAALALRETVWIDVQDSA
jgi:hypothetical protein